MALTPRQYSIDEAQQNKKIDEECLSAVFTPCHHRTDDDFCLNIDHPRMRYSEVESLVVLFNINAQNGAQIDVGKDSKDATSLHPC